MWQSMGHKESDMTEQLNRYTLLNNLSVSLPLNLFITLLILRNFTFFYSQDLEKEMAIPLQFSCLRNALDRGAWWATVHWVTKSKM